MSRDVLLSNVATVSGEIRHRKIEHLSLGGKGDSVLFPLSHCEKYFSNEIVFKIEKKRKRDFCHCFEKISYK